MRLSLSLSLTSGRDNPLARIVAALNAETPPPIFAILPAALMVLRQTMAEWLTDQANAEAVAPVFVIAPYHDVAMTQTVGEWATDRLNAEQFPPVFAIQPYLGTASF